MADKSATLDTLAEKAMVTLGDFLDQEGADGKTLAKARVAATVLSSWTRHKQTEGARDATAFMMARELARDKDELARYVQATMPGSQLAKALPVPK